MLSVARVNITVHQIGSQTHHGANKEIRAVKKKPRSQSNGTASWSTTTAATVAVIKKRPSQL